MYVELTNYLGKDPFQLSIYTLFIHPIIYTDSLIIFSCIRLNLI